MAAYSTELHDIAVVLRDSANLCNGMTRQEIFAEIVKDPNRFRVFFCKVNVFSAKYGIPIQTVIFEASDLVNKKYLI